MGILTIPKFKVRRHRTPTPGAAPGTLMQPVDLPKPQIVRSVFDDQQVEREVVEDLRREGLFSPAPGKRVWVDVQGLGDSEIIRSLGESLGLHPLIVEDIAHVHQRPKHESHSGYLYTVLRALRVIGDQGVDNEQISFILKENLLVTFQERPGDVFDPVRRRLAEGRGLIRKAGADYLFYALLDAIVDNYFPVLEAYEEVMDQLEDDVRRDPTSEVSRNIHSVRRQLRRFRRSIWPLRDLLTAFSRDEVPMISDTIKIFFRDCYDHTMQVADLVEANRERASDLSDLYMSVVGEKTNQVMSRLTVIATIFIPLTFLCGLYGMNFDPDASPYNMPELRWRFAYPAFLGVLLLVFLGMLWYFKRKGWLDTKK